MNLKLFSGHSNPSLAKAIAESIPSFQTETAIGPNMKLSPIFIHNFPSGESYCQLQDNVRGDDVFLIQGITQPANENLMDLLIMSDAARRASAARITAVIPYFGYARQDRKDKSRVPISAKLVMNILEAAGVNRVLTMDLHSPQIAGFTDLPFDQLLFEPVLAHEIKEKYKNESIVIVAPDCGAIKRAEIYSKKLGCPLALIVKNRLNDSEVQLESFVGNVKHKTVIIIDDMTESCGTLIQAAKACKERGASKVVCAITHGCFTWQGQGRLGDAMKECIIDEFIQSDTINYIQNSDYSPFTSQVLSVAPLFAKAISNIHSNQSISDLFS